MGFKRELGVGEIINQFEKKLIEEDGLTPAGAKKAANMMSKSDIDQVQKDFLRHPKVIIINKIKGTTSEVPLSQFDTPYKTKGFLRKLAREHEDIYEYLTHFLHQGGFLHLAESLMKCYFLPHTNFVTDNRVATFTIEKDGSLSYEEKFDITKIQTPANNSEFENAQGSPLASFSLKSNIKIENNKVIHQCAPLKVKANDPVAAKFFEDPRNKFSQFLSWLKESVHSLFSKDQRVESQKRLNIPHPRRKL